MLKMLFPRFAINQYVVEENQDKFLEVGTKYIIHKSLKGRRYVAQTEWHNQEFKMTMMSLKKLFSQYHLGACVPDDIWISDLIW